MSAPAPAESLWRDGAWRLLVFGEVVSFVGSQVTRVVLPILVFQLTGSALQTSLLLALETLPYLLFGLIAGAVGDRVDRRALMVGGNALNGLTLATIPILAALDALSVSLVYVVACASALIWVWTDAAAFGALPAIVGRQHLVAAQSSLMAIWTVAGLVALPAGGALAAAIGASTAIWIDAGSYLAAAVVLACIRRPFSTGAGAGAPAAARLVRRTLDDIAEGLRYLRRHALIGPLTALGFLSSLTGGAVTGLIVVYGVRQLDLPADDARLGWLFGAGAAGALVAALALPRLVRRVSPPRISLFGLTANCLLLLVVALSGDLAVSLVALFAWELAMVLTVMNGIALRAQLTPDRLQSRVNATGRMLAAGGLPLGALLGGVIADAASVRVAYIVMAAGAGLSATLGWLSALRRVDAETVARLTALADADRRPGGPVSPAGSRTGPS